MNNEKGQRMLEAVENIYGEAVMKEITKDALGKEFIQASYIQTSHAPSWKRQHARIVEDCLNSWREKPTHLAELPVASWEGKPHPPDYRIPWRLDFEHQLRTFAERAKLVFSEGKLTVEDSRQNRPDILHFAGNATIGRLRTPFRVTVNNMLFGPRMAILSFRNDELGVKALEKLSGVYGEPAAKVLSSNVMTDHGKTEFVDLFYFEPHDPRFVEKFKRDIGRTPDRKLLP
ncbi:hypothetical protein HZC09_01540 [Candidatus Micrarchaeota archaeon]|nr:hypothetical protein [Candidatus Micrarchaeota archaeon]